MKLPMKYKVIALTLIVGSPLIGTYSADAATTQLTLTVVGAPLGLTITAPSSLSLGANVTFPSTFTTTFPAPVQVTDTRSTSLGWISIVQISDLTQASPSTASISASVFSYNPGSVTKVVGGSSTITSNVAPSPGGPSIVVSSSVGTSTSAFWTPTLTLTEIGQPALGSYTGTVTSSAV
jgi:hypothetical protein